MRWLHWLTAKNSCARFVAVTLVGKTKENKMRKVLAYFMVPIVLQFCMLSLIGSMVITQTACNSATVITDITKFLPVLSDILSILVADGAIPQATADSLSQKAQTDASIITTVYNTFETAKNATPAQGSAAWNALNAAFTTFEDDSAQIFQLINLAKPDVQNKVNLIADSAQTLLAVIEALIPSSPGGAALVMFTKELPLLRFGGQAPTAPRLCNASACAVAGSSTGEPELPPNVSQVYCA